ncbi:hypothetical protein NUW54_g11087 [Trametes sanguinea]|uniref:Uncharacterized protein n=1 Tax=Trametes sanguinea TaxID=158606 RepID=A0ACC1NN29_9APHY|nr:hypothetical protein NUW54_g11087 [Trametes sanguinea]
MSLHRTHARTNLRERDRVCAFTRLQHLPVVRVVHLGAPELPDRLEPEAWRGGRARGASGRRRGVADDGELLRRGVDFGECVAKPGGLRGKALHTARTHSNVNAYAASESNASSNRGSGSHVVISQVAVGPPDSSALHQAQPSARQRAIQTPISTTHTSRARTTDRASYFRARRPHGPSPSHSPLPAATAARRIARAQEEIRNVNREARRLHTHIRDEEALLTRVLTDLKGRADPLYGAVLEYSCHRRSANARNLAYLSRMYALDGFSGNPTPGVRANTPSDGSAPPSDTGDPMHAGSALSALVTAENDELAREDGDIAAVVENDQVHEEVTGILEFLAGLCLMASRNGDNGRASTPCPAPMQLTITTTPAFLCESTIANSLCSSMSGDPSLSPVGPFYVVLGGDVAAIYDQLRPANTATGKYLPVLPIVVCCSNLNDAEAIFRLNGELFLKADPNDVYTLLQYVMWDEGPLASVRLETPGPYYAIRFGVETGIWIGFPWYVASLRSSLTLLTIQR